MTEKPFTPESKVGDIVAAHPLLARVFEDVGIDYCCGGKRSLAEVCAARGLDAATLAITLSAAARLPGGSAAGVDPASLSLTALADHIEAIHHAYLRKLTDGFTPKPDDCNTHRALLAGLAQFEADLHQHVHKENNVLFPRALAREEQLAGAN